MKTLLFFAVLVILVVATWLFIPLLQGRDADFETRLALLQGRGGDFVDTPSEATSTPPSQAPEAAPSRPLSGPAESVEAGGATGKAAETSIGEEPGDRPSIIENGQTRELGQKPLPLAPPVDPEYDTAASATDAVRTQQDATLAFLVRQRLRTLGLDSGPSTLDSELGPQARAAIKIYQREHSLPVDGQVSVALLDHLDRVLSGDGRTGEEDAETKVAEAPPAPPADQPGSADMDSARAERLPTPATEPSEDPLLERLERGLLGLLDHLYRRLFGDGRTGEEDAETKVAEAPTAPPADRPSPADMDSARAERLPTPATEPSEDPLLKHLEQVLLDHARTGEEGAAPKVAETPTAPPPDRPSPADMDSARAEQGYAQAQSNLGFMYDKRQGVPQDYVQAVKLYRKAAEQGYADAQFNLGVMYSDGQGVPQHDAEAVRWYRKAAEQGLAIAQRRGAPFWCAGG
ncbi:MAG: peptidoglycan-binding protein [Alphaproteobacteria bacterium]|nr:peptidoglycan-binding protein [Alphaproteobacteria bacterium]